MIYTYTICRSSFIVDAEIALVAKVHINCEKCGDGYFTHTSTFKPTYYMYIVYTLYV